MAYFKFEHHNPRTLFGIIRYLKGEEKNNPHPTLLCGFGVNPDFAFEEMDAVKRVWNKSDRRQYKHFLISFETGISLPNDILLDIGHKIGSYYAGEYQILMAVHFNTDNLHIHYALNTVSPMTGKKFSITNGEIYQYKRYINQILQQYNLPLVELYDDDTQPQDEYSVLP